MLRRTIRGGFTNYDGIFYTEIVSVEIKETILNGINYSSCRLMGMDDETVGVMYFIQNKFKDQIYYKTNSCPGLPYKYENSDDLFYLEYDEKLEELNKFNLIYIEDVRIDKSFRNQGWLSFLIELIITNYSETDLIVLRASPIEQKDRTRKGDKLLKDKYRSLGFKEFFFDYMILNLNNVDIDFLKK